MYCIALHVPDYERGDGGPGESDGRIHLRAERDDDLISGQRYLAGDLGGHPTLVPKVGKRSETANWD